MLTKIGGLARALYIVLAIVAGFIAISVMNVPLVLVVLGLVAGLAIPRDRMVLVMVAVIALPLIGAALTHLPAIGTQLAAVCTNLQLGAAGSAATALAIFLWDMVMEAVGGMTATAPVTGKKAVAAR